MHRQFRPFTTLVFCVTLILAVGCFASDWQLIGPEGGNVRSLAFDPSNPSRILLGTSAGQLFLSQDGGTSWVPFAHLGKGEDYVLDHIIFDPTNPATIYVAGWDLYKDTAGDVFRSDDAGRTWQALPGADGKSIRAMAMAPSDHNTLVIGALDGVFRTRDGGKTWERISPEDPVSMENHSSLKNFVSVAIDPQNPDIIYAGTRHLAWKTTNGGTTWRNIKDGMLDDSDVFSIIIDQQKPSRVFASACSGIYLSENGAELFHRVQGLPHSAIRTRVLRQDPQRSSIVYAGTTGGLWKTSDGGVRWSLVSSPDLIVNDVLIDPRDPNRVLVATDLRGVLVSSDGFAHYTTSNRGFSHRVIGGVVVDHRDPSRLYVGVMNDKDLGGLFISDDAGKSWRQSIRGLGERDIMSLQQADSDVLFAGTNHGIFYLTSLNGAWQAAEMIRGPVPEWQPKPAEPPPAPEPTVSKRKSTRTTAAVRHKPAAKPKENVIPPEDAPRVRSLQISGDTWYAATSEGLFISVDQGKKWYGQPINGKENFNVVNSYQNGTVALTSPDDAFLSSDGGKSWTEVTLPKYVTGVYDLTVMPDSTMWLATSEGGLHSKDGGQSWQYILSGLPNKDVLAVRYDTEGHRLLATAMHEHGVYESKDGGKSWQRTPEAAVSIRSVMNYQGRLLGASAHNGLLLEQSGEVASTPESERMATGTPTAAGNSTER